MTTTTPQEILDELLAGNEQYASGKVVDYVEEDDKRLSSSPQSPKAVIVSCLDSRVPVERVFNQGVGDVFVARVAGNVMNDDIVGSLEFAVLANDVRVVIVLGHTKCGAVKGACAGVELGKLTQLLEKIHPVAEKAKASYQGGDDYEAAEFYDHVAMHNAVNAADELRKASPGIAEREEKGEILIISALYDLDSQRVELAN